MQGLTKQRGNFSIKKNCNELKNTKYALKTHNFIKIKRGKTFIVHLNRMLENSFSFENLIVFPLLVQRERIIIYPASAAGTISKDNQIVD